MRFADEGVQRPDGQERNPCTETKSLRRGNTHAESRVGTGAPAYADGIQVFHGEVFLVQDFLDIRGGEGGLHAGFVAHAESGDDSVLGERGGEPGGGGFDKEDPGHGIKRL